MKYLHRYKSYTRMSRLTNCTPRKYSDLRELNNVPVGRYSRVAICPESRSAEAKEVCQYSGHAQCVERSSLLVLARYDR